MKRSNTRKQSRIRLGSRSLATVAFIAAILIIAWLSMPTSIQGGDAGEFATVMLRGGIPHPSGYPWMRIIGGLSQLLLAVGVPAVQAAAIPCALSAVLAWIVIAHVLNQYSPRLLAYGLSFVVAASPLAIAHVYDSEVWGLHLLLCSLVVALALSRKPSNIFVLGCVFGIAISHHLTAVFLFPLVVGACWFETRSRQHASESRSWQSSPTIHDGITGLTALVTCATIPYTFLAIGNHGAWRWGDTGSVQGWLTHVTRAEYGSFQLSLHTETVGTQELWARSWGKIIETFSSDALTHPGFGFAFMISIFLLARKAPAGVRKSTWTGYWISIGATTLLFPSLANINPTQSTGAWILERFDLLSVLLWLLPVAIAWTRVISRLPERIATLSHFGLLSILVASCLTPYRMNYRPRNDHGVQSYARDLLNTPEIGKENRLDSGRSVIIGTDDHRTFPVLFMQEVMGLRPDVLYIDAQLLAHSWYRQRLQRKLKGLPDVDKPLRLIGAIFAHPTLKNTPIYLANIFSKPAARLQIVPEGILWRVVPPNGSIAAMDPKSIHRRHIAALGRATANISDFPPEEDSALHPWSRELRKNYFSGTRQLIDALREEGLNRAALDLELKINAWAEGS